MHWKVEGVCTSAQLQSHSVSNLRVWGAAEAQNHAVFNIKIRCEGQENSPPTQLLRASACKLYPAFSGGGRAWETPLRLALRFLSGHGGMTRLFSLCCCSQHPMAYPKAAHVSNFGKDVGREEEGRFFCYLSFCGVPVLCSLQWLCQENSVSLNAPG